MNAAQRKALRLLNDLKRIERQFQSALVKAFPVGSTVHYRHGDTLRSVQVRDHSGNLMLVAGRRDNAYWIYAYRIVDELDAI